MTYIPVIEEQKFLLNHIVKFDDISSCGTYQPIAFDVVEAILEGSGVFAASKVEVP